VFRIDSDGTLTTLHVFGYSDEVEAASTDAADAGNVFRYADGEYILNVNTKGLQAGTWELRIDLLDEESRSVLISLRK
jgi:hypothetical protein